MMGKMNLALFFGATLALVGTLAPAAAQSTCSGGIPGVQSTSTDVCCTEACGTCGGPGCTPANTSSLTAGDCCATEILDSGVFCSDSGAAPCILSTVAASNDSVCDNGQTGVQDPDTDVCCPLECGEFCGGDGCGTIPGVDASQCCAAAIMESGVICGEGVDAPCNQGSVADAESVCSNGLAGIESEEVCCDAACGVCGGAECGNQPGLTGADCCIAEIEAAAQLCSVTGAAPCVVDPPAVTPSTCPNGLEGVADGSVCCAVECNGVCGGTGCGSIAGTNGASDCCSATILATNTPCGEAPCVMVPGTYTDAPAAAPIMTMAPLAPGETIAPTVASRDISFTMAPTPTSQTAAPTSASRDLDFTGVPTAAPSSAMDFGESSAPTTASRDLDFTAGPTGSMAPTTFTFPPGTLPPSLIAGSSSLSAGSFVTIAAMAGGMFAVFAAARN